MGDGDRQKVYLGSAFYIVRSTPLESHLTHTDEGLLEIVRQMGEAHTFQDREL